MIARLWRVRRPEACATWDEVRELLYDSYRRAAPKRLAEGRVKG